MTFADRYVRVSPRLSGCSLVPRSNVENPCQYLQPPQKPGAFLDRWQLDDIATLLSQFGITQHWQRQGFQQLQLDTRCGGGQFTLDITADKEVLLCLNTWLEYLYIDAKSKSYPSLAVERLILQNPHAQTTQLAVGQTHPSSELLRKLFPLFRYFASQCGARFITAIAEYFHTAYIFAKKMRFIDAEMQAIFQQICSDLNATTRAKVNQISLAFEEHRVTRNGKIYLWPTELMYYDLDKATLDEKPFLCRDHFEMQTDI